MYIIVEKSTNNALIIKEKTVLSTYIGVCTRTILRKEHLNRWETDEYYVYNPVFVQEKYSCGRKKSKKR